MRVFVTGANGFIGSALTPVLAIRGHEVVGLAKDEAAAAALRLAGVEPVVADLADTGALAAAAGRADAVIHLALQLGSDVARIDRAAIDAMLSALKGTGKVFVGTSAAGLVGDTGPQAVDEARALPAGGPNGWRVENEARVLAAGVEGIRALAIRPAPLVFGHRGGALLPKLVAHARETGVAHYVGTGAQAWSTAYVDDVAMLFALALDHGESGHAYFAASGEATPWQEIAAAIANAAGLRDRTGSWTAEQAQAVVGFLGGLMAIDVRVKNDKARALGWSPAGPTVLEDIAHYG